jgi:hypothetical protein
LGAAACRFPSFQISDTPRLGIRFDRLRAGDSPQRPVGAGLARVRKHAGEIIGSNSRSSAWRRPPRRRIPPLTSYYSTCSRFVRRVPLGSSGVSGGRRALLKSQEQSRTISATRPHRGRRARPSPSSVTERRFTGNARDFAQSHIDRNGGETAHEWA